MPVTVQSKEDQCTEIFARAFKIDMDVSLCIKIQYKKINTESTGVFFLCWDASAFPLISKKLSTMTVFNIKTLIMKISSHCGYNKCK